MNKEKKSAIRRRTKKTESNKKIQNSTKVLFANNYYFLFNPTHGQERNEIFTSTKLNEDHTELVFPKTDVFGNPWNREFTSATVLQKWMGDADTFVREELTESQVSVLKGYICIDYKLIW